MPPKPTKQAVYKAKQPAQSNYGGNNDAQTDSSNAFSATKEGEKLPYRDFAKRDYAAEDSGYVPP